MSEDMSAENNPQPSEPGNSQPREVPISPLTLATETRGIDNAYMISRPTGGRGATDSLPPLPSPGYPDQPHGRRGFLKAMLGVGITAVLAGGAVGLAKVLSGGGGGPGEGGVVDSTPKPESTPTTKPTEAPTATPTPEKTPDPEKIFMKDAIREDYGNSILATDKDYSERTICNLGLPGVEEPCPGMERITLNPDIPNNIERLQEGSERIKAIAWMRLAKGLSEQQVLDSFDTLYEEYNKRTAGGEKLAFNVYSFTDEDNYGQLTSTEVDSSYKIEHYYSAQPDKYTSISIAKGKKAGIVVNHDAKVITLLTFDYSAGGINQRGQYPTYQVGASTAITNTGLYLGDKTIQTNQKFNNSSDGPRVLGLLYKIQEPFIDKKSNDWIGDWTGIVIAK